MKNLDIFERILGAKRTQLSHNWCGHVFRSQEYRAFQGVEHFSDESMWRNHYQGPDFGSDLNACFLMEDEIKRHRQIEPYLRCLCDIVYPAWDKISKEADVFAFWYGLTHATAKQRVNAAIRMLKNAPEPKPV